MLKFNEKYNQVDFLNFINDFLPEDFNQKEEDIVIKQERYKEVTKAKILGFCESLDLHVLEMDHSHENDPRITITTDAFKILACTVPLSSDKYSVINYKNYIITPYVKKRLSYC